MPKKKATPSKLSPQVVTSVGETQNGGNSKRSPQFRPTNKFQERHRQPLYCISWGTDVHADVAGKKFQYLATCGANQLTVYEVEMGNPKGVLKLKQSYRDEDTEEHFYACVFGGRSKYWGSSAKDNFTDTSDSDGAMMMAGKLAGQKRDREGTGLQKRLILETDGTKETNYLGLEHSFPDGPQLLCVAGAGSTVKIIDPVQKRQVCSLLGHGSDIYDLKVSPSNEMLLLSASVDESVRLWNLQSFACVSIFAGQHGHREAVLSLSWHPEGHSFASAGMDKSIRLWRIDNARTKEAFQASHKLMPSGNRKSFHPLIQQFPYFATKKVHMNYVDCVQFLGDMILSKSTYNLMVLWMPNIKDRKTGDAAVKKAAYSPPSDVIALRTFDLDNCNIWFVRFSIDTMGKLLAVGNIKGEIDLWDIDSCEKDPAQTLKPMVSSTIRMLSFSPDGKTLVACNDSAAVCRWDEY